MALKIGELWAQIRLETAKFDSQLEKIEKDMDECAAQAKELRARIINAVPGSPEAKKLEAELSATEKRMKQLGAAAKDAEADLRSAGGAMQSFGKKMTMGVTMPLIAAGGAFFKAASSQAAWAEELGNLNAQTGLSTTKLQELKYIADTSGLSFEGLTNATGVLQRKLLGIEEGGGPAAAVMTELGVSITGADGQMRSMNDLFPELIAKLQQVENPTRRNALATQIFGRSALELAPILAMSKEEMDKLTKAAHDSGNVMGKHVVEALAKFDEKIDGLEKRVAGFVTQVVGGFFSLPEPIQGAILAIAGIAVVAGPIMQIIALITTFKKALQAAKLAANLAKLQFIQTWLAAAGPILPLIAAIAGVGLAVYAVIKYWKPIKAFFANLWDGIKGIFTAHVNWIISLPAKIAQGWNVLKGFFEKLWAAIYDATVRRLGRIFTAIKNFLARIFGLGGGSKAPAPPTPAAAGAAASAKAGAGQPAVVRMSPDVEAAIKKTAANTKPQPRFA